jgi:predicted GIY-YIG superfamily endonuclease
VKAKAAAPQRSAGGRKQPCAKCYGSAGQQGTMQFFYVYILQSESASETKHFYVGRTEDLHARLKKHNAGEVPHTAKYRPWQIKTAIAFTEERRAIDFERYLKSGSGRAFVKKHL